MMTQFVNCLTRLSLKSLSSSSTNSLNIVNSFVKLSANNFYNVRNISTTLIKNDRLYSDKHEWILVKENIGTVGISSYAQEALGDVVYVELPDVGKIIKKEDEVGALESVKAASELISPVSGKVIEKNSDVENKPGLVNTSCYDQGWLYKVELSSHDEVSNLMDEKTYQEYLKTDH
ncbi:hypothetical protein HCN44_000899 [Aphidius gifuensis]|uniref:Glycine cleavage system H protein n=1 Tax=Aphidius gifuensis TaxID=684658 RepID=A0A834XLS4_APHGI|nr:glycine cleavage system H protein, mitochondrial-like [Aphidius gifuensis]KAF7988326.1 hypothetical protein HCN44_000899 [Aphidius gifuensis]